VSKKKPDGRGRWRRVTVAQWRRVDWSLSNVRIAGLLGCSFSLVTIGRRNWGRPLRRKSDAFRDYLAADAKNLHGLPNPGGGPPLRLRDLLRIGTALHAERRHPQVPLRDGRQADGLAAAEQGAGAGVGAREGVRREAEVRAGGARGEVGLAEQGDGRGPGLPAGGGGGAAARHGGGRGGGGGGECGWN
jgi:hypothetical protein